MNKHLFPIIVIITVIGVSIFFFLLDQGKITYLKLHQHS